MTATAETIPAEIPAVVLFGRDETNKPHASCFTESEVAAAKRAAALMGMTLLPVSTDEQRALAAKVPRGRIFGTGRAFVPFIKAPLLQELESAAVKAGIDTKASRKARAWEPVGPREDAPNQPKHWDEIGVGSIVLAATPPKFLDWFECVVIAVEGDELRLAFCDWPHQPPFVRPRSEVGLLHPTYVPEPPLQAAE